MEQRWHNELLYNQRMSSKGIEVYWKENVKYSPLLESDKILLSVLHVKLSHMKNRVKPLDKDGPDLQSFEREAFEIE